jgi:transcriptional regulator with XRE-family HTH domain
VLTVKLEMRRAGLTGEAVARATGYTPSAVSLVVTGRRRNPIIETYIAARVGLPTRELFPPTQERRQRERRARERRSA